MMEEMTCAELIPSWTVLLAGVFFFTWLHHKVKVRKVEGVDFS